MEKVFLKDKDKIFVKLEISHLSQLFKDSIEMVIEAITSFENLKFLERQHE